MGAMASQITSLTIVYLTVYSRCRSKKTSKLRVTGLCAENSPVTGEYLAQRTSNAGKCCHLMTSSWTLECLITVMWYAYCAINLSHKSQNALYKYITILHFVTEMCTRAHFCYKMVHCVMWNWRIVGYATGAFVIANLVYMFRMELSIANATLHNRAPFNTVRYFMLLHTTLQWWREVINHHA